MSLNAQNHDVVSAGTAQIVAPTTAVQLVGNVGKPDTNATYSYSWAQTTDPSLPAVVLSNSDTPTASFVTPKIPGLYTFRFTVTKTVGLQVSTMTADTAVTVKADPVTLFSVSAGDAKTAALNSTVALNGAVDVQTGGATSTATYAYKWTQVSGPTVVLANTNAKTASFVPTVAGTYVFSLDVSATSTGGTITANGLTQVVVLPAASPANPTTANVAMSVNAGAIQTALPNAIVTLTGTKTVQGTDTGVTYAYQWVQTDVATAPATVAITNASSTNASIRVALPGIYYFQFVVNATLPDGSVRTSSAMTSVVVGAASKGLTATAGNAQSGNVSKPVILTGAVSTQGDYSNALFAYKWTQISGSTLSLSNSNNAVASFVPILPGVYSFRFDVTVTDNGKTSTTSTTTQVLVLL